MQKIKQILPFAIYLALILTVFQFCKKPVKPAGTFTVNVEGKTFTGANVEIEEPIAIRGQFEVEVATAYLISVANAANITAKIASELKDKKKVLPAIWALTPILITDLPELIKAGKSLRKFQELYVAAGGLTADERATVANGFAIHLDLPYPIAEEISEATIEAALANMKLAGTIQAAVKK